MRRWLLPEYIDDVLPVEARRIERLRRRALDLFAGHGYELVMPPLLEYVESLLTGTGHDLDLRTFKLVDQLSGRMLGVRADITPQVARIDAHLLNRAGVTRLCYCGSVLHTLPSGMDGTREPLQLGAEIYGHAGVESDIEVQRLMLKVLRLARVSNVHLDIGHVGVFRALVRSARLTGEREAELFQAVQAKDAAAIARLTRGLPRALARAFAALPELSGDRRVLAAAKRLLPASAGIRRALATLATLARGLADLDAELGFDLGELRGYRYHSGVVFAAYTRGAGAGFPNAVAAIALGGRYDEVGKAFGRARPATGFTMDLRALAAAAPPTPPKAAILAPFAPRDRVLQARIAQLRARGTVVIEDLPGHRGQRAELGCDRRLVKRSGRWVVGRLAE
jgi:ATP phosphoribosyltransferase regulatory subunit